MKKTIITGLTFFLAMTLLTGIVYPLAMTGVSQVAFNKQSNGSIIEIDGVKYGSELLAQQFTEDKYMWGRIMYVNTETFTTDDGKPAMYSGASNKSPKSEDIDAAVKARLEQLKTADPDNKQAVPVDLVTGSGSGLDPEISPAAAEYQINRIAKARNISNDEVKAIIDKYTIGRTFGIIGEPRVNVLKVNLALEGILK